VNITRVVILISSSIVYSSSFHKQPGKKHGFAPFLRVINRFLWISFEKPVTSGFSGFFS